MSASHGSHGSHGHPPADTGRFDDEIDVRGIVQVGLWLAVVTIASFAIVYFFYKGLLSSEKKQLDAKPSPVAEANAPRVPPGPQLQSRPEVELATFRAAETARLEGWGWVDKAAGVAHVPVEKAIGDVVAKGIPDFAIQMEAAAP